MSTTGRRTLIMLLLGANDGESISGITRLQKLLFILEREEGIAPQGEDFDFKAYKMGPYSSKLYDDLEMLENLGLIESTPSAAASEESREETDLQFDDLMDEDEKSGADAGEERRYKLTAEGMKRFGGLVADGGTAPVAEKIRKVKSKFSTYSLQDLLHYVYTRHPESTTESEIKDQVLGRQKRG